jgi:amidohydrolase
MLKQDTIQADVEALDAQLVAWRRDFHAHPELGFQEHRTARVIADLLREWGYRVQTGVATTGVVGLLSGSDPGPVVMLRFDMDALPVTEENDVDYASEIEGVMHACGHDAHMAIGLGVAKWAADHQAEMAGTLKLVFQPAEEGLNGAEVMVEEGVLENPRPDICIAAHVWNDRPAGEVNVTPGPVMAAAERWRCTIHGDGGHGALPHQTVDPIVATAQVVSALQTIVSRNVSPLETAVVTVGSIHGGTTFNVIPPAVELTGTIRTYDAQVRETVLQRMHQLVEGVAEALGGRADLEIRPLTPAVVNDPQVTDVVRAAAERVVGAEHVGAGQRMVASEDAAFFIREIPGCYFFLGSGRETTGADVTYHNPRFNLDEGVLSVGVAVMLHALAHYL